MNITQTFYHDAAWPGTSTSAITFMPVINPEDTHYLARYWERWEAQKENKKPKKYKITTYSSKWSE